VSIRLPSAGGGAADGSATRGRSVTEAEWLKGTDSPRILLAHLREVERDEDAQFGGPVRQLVGRKVRLFSVACCRRNWHLLTDDRSRTAILTAEQLAEGNLNQTEVDGVRANAYAVYENTSRPGSGFPDATVGITLGRWESAQAPVHALLVYDNVQETFRAAMIVSEEAVEAAVSSAVDEAPHPTMAGFLKRAAQKVEHEAHCNLLRDIFGNPFRPIVVDPRWQTESVVALATVIYAEWAFDRMPILADALEEAGCDHADFLAHCRGPGPHVRGCWVVDLVLGKG
jgi:hypothetical protein